MLEGLSRPEAMLGRSIGPGVAIVLFTGPTSATPFGEAGNDCGEDSGRMIEGLSGPEAMRGGTIGPGMAIVPFTGPTSTTSFCEGVDDCGED
jgi:hypothetical protein